MWQEVIVEKSDLRDLEGLEKRLKGRIMDIQPVDEEKALVKYAPVVNDSWFIEVWDHRATLCIVDQFGFVNLLEDAFSEWDEEALQAVIEQVLKDYGITLEDTGQYYPITQEAEEAFQQFMARARRKPRVR